MVVRQIVHMDLKSPNVLLQDRNCLVAKIADLGLSRQIAEGSLLTNSGHGMYVSMSEFSLLSAYRMFTAWYCVAKAAQRFLSPHCCGRLHCRVQ